MAKILSSSRRIWILAGTLFGVVLIAGAGFFFGYYRGHVLPGMTVAGVPLSGQTPAQVQQTLQEKFDEQALSFTVPDEESKTITTVDTGVDLDTVETVEHVFAANANPISMIRGFFASHDIEPVVTVDEGEFAEFAQSLLPSESHAPADASVHFDADSGMYYAKESKPGEIVDVAELQDEVVAAAVSLMDAQIAVPLQTQDPATETQQAVDAATQANMFLDAGITVVDSYQDVASPERAEKVEWLEFKGEGADFKPVLKKKKVTAWVQEFADESSTAPVTGLRNVDESGKEVAVSLPAEDGYGVSNVDRVVGVFKDALVSGESAAAVFSYDDLPATWEDRLALSGTEKLVYRPAEGEKWLDLDLTNAEVTAYEGDRVVGGPWLMVPGEPLTPTVTGEYNVYLKYEMQDMRGENYDGTKYLTKDVPWVTYFYGGYGFHGAPWRETFGWNGPGGSHGCINMEILDAKFIYDWADYGTKVVSHD